MINDNKLEPRVCIDTYVHMDLRYHKKDGCASKDKKESKDEIVDQKAKEIEGVIITADHASDDMNCVGYSGAKYFEYYQKDRDTSTSRIGQPAWFTRDLLKEFLPDLMSNEKIIGYTNTNLVKQYHATNFAITFECEEDTKCGNAIDYTYGSPSGMWCNKEGKKGHAGEKCPDEFLVHNKSVCCKDSYPYYDNVYSKNFFLNEKCPNLVLDRKKEELKECAGKTIVAKLASPLIIADRNSTIIDQDGNNTGVNYLTIRPFLNSDGTVKKECENNQQCKKYSTMIDKILWTSDKEVKLKIPDNVGEKRSYSPSVSDNQDEIFSYNEGVLNKLCQTEFLVQLDF